MDIFWKKTCWVRGKKWFLQNPQKFQKRARLARFWVLHAHFKQIFKKIAPASPKLNPNLAKSKSQTSPPPPMSLEKKSEKIPENCENVPKQVIFQGFFLFWTFPIFRCFGKFFETFFSHCQNPCFLTFFGSSHKKFFFAEFSGKIQNPDPPTKTNKTCHSDF